MIKSQRCDTIFKEGSIELKVLVEFVHEQIQMQKKGVKSKTYLKLLIEFNEKLEVFCDIQVKKTTFIEKYKELINKFLNVDNNNDDEVLDKMKSLDDNVNDEEVHKFDFSMVAPLLQDKGYYIKHILTQRSDNSIFLKENPKENKLENLKGYIFDRKLHIKKENDDSVTYYRCSNCVSLVDSMNKDEKKQLEIEEITLSATGVINEKKFKQKKNHFFKCTSIFFIDVVAKHFSYYQASQCHSITAKIQDVRDKFMADTIKFCKFFKIDSMRFHLSNNWLPSNKMEHTMRSSKYNYLKKLKEQEGEVAKYSLKYNGNEIPERFEYITNDDRIKLYFTDDDIIRLANCERWGGDGTFGIVPRINNEKQFAQVYILMGKCVEEGFSRNCKNELEFEVRHKYFQFVTALTKEKSAEIYIKIFSILSQEMKRLNVKNKCKVLMIDCETGVAKACEKIFPEIKILFCHFHYCQNIYKHIRLGGLTNLFRQSQQQFANEKDVDKCLHYWLRMLFCIPLLPSSRIREVGNEILNVLNNFADFLPLLEALKLRKFIEYYENQWLSEKKGVTFERLSKYKILDRTNNSLEANNMSLKGRGISGRHNQLAFFEGALKIIQYNFTVDYEHHKNRNDGEFTFKKRRRKHKRVDFLIEKLFNEYDGNFDAFHFLDHAVKITLSKKIALNFNVGESTKNLLLENKDDSDDSDVHEENSINESYEEDFEKIDFPLLTVSQMHKKEW
uniref:MULE domain-containing protein n=1 Tax=Strongyloides venezuelensis TaxID=75913 RepID=A0A0K0FJS0_STRVS